MNSCRITLATVFAAYLVIAAICDIRASDKLIPVSWSEVRTEIAAHICVHVDSLPNGWTSRWSQYTVNERCTGPTGSAALVRAVEKTLRKNAELVIPVEMRLVGFVISGTIPQEIQSKSLQNAYLTNDVVLRPLLRSLPKELASQGLICPDLPILPPRPIRTVRWSEFARYLSAYIWPDTFPNPPDSNGQSLRKTTWCYHVCTGINGIDDAIVKPDEYLVYVACAIAMHNEDFMSLGERHFNEEGKSHEFKTLTDVSERTEYLRRTVPARVAADPKLKEIALKRIKKHPEDLAIRFEP
jgi:hypothetical protein